MTRYMKTYLAATAGTLGVLLLLSSCGREPELPIGNSPDTAIMNSIAALRANDLEGLLRNALTPEQFTRLEFEWDQERTRQLTEQETAEFAANMDRLLAPDAEENIMAELEPQLDELRKTMPLVLGLMQTGAMAALQDENEYNDQQREMGEKAIQSVVAWAQQTDLSDPVRARSAVQIAIDTARSMNVTTLEDVRALDLMGLLDRGDLAIAGAKEVLEVYGIAMDETLDSVRVRTLERDGDQATVEVTLDFLGVTYTFEEEMVRDEGRWISREALDRLDQPESTP